MIGLLQHSAAGDRTGCHGREARRVDHRKAGLVFTAALRDLPSVNIAWQLDVGNQDVRDLPSARARDKGLVGTLLCYPTSFTIGR